jgi:hypothetical protein
MKSRSDKVIVRVEKQGDLFAQVEKLKQELPKGRFNVSGGK